MSEVYEVIFYSPDMMLVQPSRVLAIHATYKMAALYALEYVEKFYKRRRVKRFKTCKELIETDNVSNIISAMQMLREATNRDFGWTLHIEVKYNRATTGPLELV